MSLNMTTNEFFMMPGINTVFPQSSVSSIFLDNYFKSSSLSSNLQHLLFHAHSQSVMQHAVFLRLMKQQKRISKCPNKCMYLLSVPVPMNCVYCYKLFVLQAVINLSTYVLVSTQPLQHIALANLLPLLHHCFFSEIFLINTKYSLLTLTLKQFSLELSSFFRYYIRFFPLLYRKTSQNSHLHSTL